jgi:hypothetical protein
MRCGSFLVVIALLPGGCGGGGEAGAGTPLPCIEEPKTGSGNCLPELSFCWLPNWKPPRPDPTACTEAQVLDDKSKCWGADFDPTCSAFERDPANATCLQCLFSSSDEPTYGALILLPNGGLHSNVPGCLALVDGDTSSNGCGARYQAYEQCLDAACMQNCASYDDYTSCSTVAALGVCAPFLRAAVCRLRPAYAPCMNYIVFDEFFFATARAFCILPIDAGTGDDSGASPDDGGETGTPVPEASVMDGSD